MKGAVFTVIVVMVCIIVGAVFADRWEYDLRQAEAMAVVMRERAEDDMRDKQIRIIMERLADNYVVIHSNDVSLSTDTPDAELYIEPTTTFTPTNNAVFGGGETDDPVMVITFDPAKIEIREDVEASDTAREVLRLMQEYLYDWCGQRRR